jgi:putative phosphoribosyl transferase
VQDRTAIIVDDGIATGATVLVALRALARAEPKQTIVAVPVAPPEAVAKLSHEADEIVCLSVPSAFQAVNLHYQDFTQTSDDEVIELLEEKRCLDRNRAATRVLTSD